MIGRTPGSMVAGGGWRGAVAARAAHCGPPGRTGGTGGTGGTVPRRRTGPSVTASGVLVLMASPSSTPFSVTSWQAPPAERGRWAVSWA
ncbi:hypothetical protein [Streptomyces halobius]|uniref:Secreted protein n=1 Tax=Streptomyces halobius TaxID=2879846 RepID=A0ABY4MET5_9ACTN|nr:hypothetical protein [Streptomyces halobius]UQA96274.1 hypothetical protein K9S39_34305 [Streptomyces halobius]